MRPFKTDRIQIYYGRAEQMSDRRFDFLNALILVFVSICFGVFFLLRALEASIPEEPEDQLIESVDHPTLWGEPRSSSWASVRRKFVESNPNCVACGSTEKLNVHHVKPFHAHPELELEPSNLITLCREHHFRIGHDPDGPWSPLKPAWTKSNPFVRKHAQLWRETH